MGAFWPELYYFFVFFTSFWKSFWSKKSSKNANIREGLQLLNQLNLKILKFPAIIIILQVDNWLENQNKNANSTLCSQAVSHPSTNRAQCCLTSVIGRELVHSAWYGRWLRIMLVQLLYQLLLLNIFWNFYKSRAKYCRWIIGLPKSKFAQVSDQKIKVDSNMQLLKILQLDKRTIKLKILQVPMPNIAGG